MGVAHAFFFFCGMQYSKNFGLYGERIGALNIVTKDASVVGKIRSQLNGWVPSDLCSYGLTSRIGS